MFERFRAKRTADESTTTTDRDGAPGTSAYPRRDVVQERAVPITARGGVSFGGILTGVVVAFGAMFLLTAIIVGILVALGVQQGDVSAGEALQAGIWTGVGLVVAQFLAYMWGGYTAGRMGRGAGVVNGLLVALAAIVIAVAVAGIGIAVGANVDFDRAFGANMPFDPQNLADDPEAQGWGIGLSIAMLAAMFIGAAIGGGLGARWHTKLERDHWEHGAEEREIDLRERRGTTTTAGQPVTTGAGTSANRTTTQPPPPDRS